MDRQEREKEIYNHGALERVAYQDFFSHTHYFHQKRRLEIIKSEFEYMNGRCALELGSTCWISWISHQGISPSELTCINISTSEIERGRKIADRTRLKPVFREMDAMSLEFPDESLDFVFGGAILHHLDFGRAIAEVHRVLKPDGRMLFVEPLGINPVSKLIRLATPHARTPDEKPLGMAELRELDRYFETTHYVEEFLSVPLGVVSRLLFRQPDNSMMRLAFKADLSIMKNVPFLRNYFRHIIVTGIKRQPG